MITNVMPSFFRFTVYTCRAAPAAPCQSMTGDLLGFGATDFRFGAYVNHSMSQPADDKSSLKGAGSESRD